MKCDKNFVITYRVSGVLEKKSKVVSIFCLVKFTSEVLNCTPSELLVRLEGAVFVCFYTFYEIDNPTLTPTSRCDWPPVQA